MYVTLTICDAGYVGVAILLLKICSGTGVAILTGPPPLSDPSLTRAATAGPAAPGTPHCSCTYNNTVMIVLISCSETLQGLKGHLTSVPSNSSLELYFCPNYNLENVL